MYLPKTYLLLFLWGLCCHLACQKETSPPQITLPPPVITYPPPQSTQSNCVLIQWQPVNNILNYTLQIATDTLFSFNGSIVAQAEPAPDNSSHLFTLPISSSYWARMNVVNETGSSPWSQYLPFTVDATNPADCFDIELISPQLLLPQHADTLQGNTQTFTWQPIPGAQKYQLQIAQTANFTSVAYSNNQLLVPERTVQNFTSGKYYWRVRATNNSYQSNWSETRQFTILP